MGKTSIEWTEHSENPIRARLGMATGHYCEKVSPGCKNCYSSRLQPRFGMPTFNESRGKAEPFLDPKTLERILRRRKPTTFFWCDMTDMFGEWVPDEWIAACFGVMAATPQHTHQVLTKRSKRMREWFEWVSSEPTRHALVAPLRALHSADVACQVHASERCPGLFGHGSIASRGWPLRNVHLGVSAEDQQRWDERVPELLQTPAAVRWVSAEPLLGPIGVSAHLTTTEPALFTPLSPDLVARHRPETRPVSFTRGGIDWVVVGSESGPSARSMAIEWARDIVTQCQGAGVAVFVKQVATPAGRAAGDRKGGDPQHWPEDLRVREYPGGAT